jgi:allantoinase
VSHCKGRIAPGYDADLVVWDPDAEWTVDAARLHHRHAVTPYAGRALHGAVRQVFLRGNPISHDGRVTNGRPGRWLRGCMRVV